jgi:alpha-glucosidase
MAVQTGVWLYNWQEIESPPNYCQTREKMPLTSKPSIKSLSLVCALSCIAGLPLSSLSASSADRIETAELFCDQGPLFFDPPEPSAEDPVTVSICCHAGNIDSAGLKYYDEGDRKSHLLPMKKTAAGNASYEYWQAKIPPGRSRKHYHFILHRGTQLACYNAGGASASESDSNENNDFRILPDFHTPDWLKDGIIYQIFPDRFFDGDPGNNIKTGQYSIGGSAVVQKTWGESPLPTHGENRALVFYGGDLAGVLAKLPYIRETVGANIIYLNPIFESPSNHKYDTTDYRQIASCLGTDKTLGLLSSALHTTAGGKRGYLLLDGVFNHTGDTHKWFCKYEYRRASKEKGAYESQNSPFYSYYTFAKWPEKYAIFLDALSCPKLNYGSPALKKEIFGGKDSIALHYLQPPFNIDGWRIDAPQFVDREGKNGSDNFNHEIWREFRKVIKATNPQAAILGENWQNSTDWIVGGDQWDSFTNFDGFTEPVSRWLCAQNIDDKPSSINVSEFDRWLRLTRAHYPFNVQLALSNHLDNHDISRFAERAHGDPGKVSLALIFQMTYVGVPTIYYGDEYGMQGARDPDDRRTFDWAQVENKNQLIAFTHKLIQLRDKNSALRRGSFVTLDLNDKNNTYAYARLDRHNCVVVGLNADSAEHVTPVSVRRLGIPDGSRLTDELSGTSYQVEDGKVALKLAPRSGSILAFWH